MEEWAPLQGTLLTSQASLVGTTTSSDVRRAALRGSAIVLQRGPRTLACNAEWGQHAKATVNRNVSKRESGTPCALLTNCVPSFKSLPYLASGSQIVGPPVNPKRVSCPEFPSRRRPQVLAALLQRMQGALRAHLFTRKHAIVAFVYCTSGVSEKPQFS